ncbi:MAG: lamin tail domain-containing protein [Chloroflexi bacterium]|nr:lamin tail domain-containing protein [Chloroflexota bacterium]
MSADLRFPLAAAFLSLMALAVGCSGSEPTRTVITTGATSPPIQATATPIPLTAVPTALPSTAVPVPGGTPTPQAVNEMTAVPPLEPTVEPGHQAEPTADPNAVTPEVRVTIAPAPTETVPPVPTATNSPTPTATPPAAEAGVVIECVFFDGLVRTTEADEYVQVLNQGQITVDLLGWRLVDESDGFPEFAFPAYELQPQASVRVYTNEDHPDSGGFSFQRKSSVWNNSSPDTAGLIDPSGTVVSTKSYPPGC